MLKKISLAIMCATTIILNGININLNTVKANDSKLKYRLIDVAEGVEPVLYESNVYNICENTVDRKGMLSTRSDDGHDYDLSWNVSPFSNGLAPAYKEGKFGYINSSGKVVVPFEYDVAFQFNEDGKAMVGIDPEPDVNDYAGVHHFDMQFGYINKDGKIVEPISKYLEVLEDTTYDILEYDKNLPNRIQERMLHGVLNRRMSRALSIGAVTRLKSAYIVDKYDSDGSVAMPLVKYAMGYFVNGVPKTDIWDFRNELVLDSEGRYNYGLTKYGDKQMGPAQYAMGYKKPDGTMLTDFKYGRGNLLGPFKGEKGEERAPFSRYKEPKAGMPNNKWGFLDMSGKEVIPDIYEEYRPFSEGCANVKLNGKWGYIDKDGKELIPFKYEKADSFQEGYARVSLDGEKWGVINKKGEMVIPAEFKFLSNFNDGLAWAMVDSKWQILSINNGEDATIILNPRNGEPIKKYNPGKIKMEVFMENVEKPKKDGYIFLEWLDQGIDWGYIYNSTYIGDYPGRDLYAAYIDEDIVGDISGYPNTFEFIKDLHTLKPICYNISSPLAGPISVDDIKVFEDNEFLLKNYDLDKDGKLSKKDNEMLFENINEDYFDKEEIQ